MVEASHSRNLYDRGVWGSLGLLAITCAALWLLGGRTYFVKPLTESHNILLAAANIRDLLTVLVQDLATSPDPVAHPFWYIHHPNLPAKLISFGLGRFGLGLEGQVGTMLALNVAGLAIASAAFSRISRASALAALVIAATSYGSFHYSAGDLCRGPLYLMLWPFLFALIGNEALQDRGKNVTIGSVSALSVLSDWGFALFVVTFAFCWSSLGRGRPPWRWYFFVVALPTACALILYEMAVIWAVGWDFFLFDAYTTYLGRLGIGDYLDYRSVLERFHDNLVIVWPAQGQGSLSLTEVLGTLAIKPLLNTGPAWILLMPTLVCGAATIFARIGWGRLAWGTIAILIGLNLLGILPVPVLLPAVVAVAIGLARVRVTTTTERLCGLAAALVLAITVPAVIFPGFTIGFSIGGGRPPFPLLEMSGAALLAEFAASGQLARWLTRMSATRIPVRRLFASSAHGAWAFVAVSIVTVLAVMRSELSLFGVSRDLAAGLAMAMIGVPVIAVVESRSYICARRDSLAAREGGIVGVLLRLLRRWHISVILALTTLVLASHVSDHPTVVGRYSLNYAMFLMAPLLLTLLAILFAAFPAAGSFLLNVLRHRLMPPGIGERLTNSPASQCVQVAVACLALGQIGWFILSVAAHPPRPIPYALLLAQPEYRGKSFLTTSYEGIVWNSTRGWAYMTSTNPPQLHPISSRFRHLADWKNEAKYGRPDYFLCDDGLLSSMRPGNSVDGAPAPMTCRKCTCKDVAAFLRGAGHDVVVDRDDFSIVKFKWGGH